jgi:PAS domain S-box-containing protein
MPFYICPRCKNRRIDHDGREGFSPEVPACHHCGFGFMWELMDDYYPAQATGFVVCDQDARVLATGEGVFELTGYREEDLMGRNVVDALALSDTQAVETVREWGVRKLEQKLTLRTNTGLEKPVLADLFPAYDDDGGLLVALTPR